MAFCVECGAKLSEKAKFCGECGNTVTASTPPATLEAEADRFTVSPDPKPADGAPLHHETTIAQDEEPFDPFAPEKPVQPREMPWREKIVMFFSDRPLEEGDTSRTEQPSPRKQGQPKKVPNSMWQLIGLEVFLLICANSMWDLFGWLGEKDILRSWQVSAGQWSTVLVVIVGVPGLVWEFIEAKRAK